MPLVCWTCDEVIPSGLEHEEHYAYTKPPVLICEDCAVNGFTERLKEKQMEAAPNQPPAATESKPVKKRKPRWSDEHKEMLVERVKQIIAEGDLDNLSEWRAVTEELNEDFDRELTPQAWRTAYRRFTGRKPTGQIKKRVRKAKRKAAVKPEFAILERVQREGQSPVEMIHHVGPDQTKLINKLDADDKARLMDGRLQLYEIRMKRVTEIKLQLPK